MMMKKKLSTLLIAFLMISTLPLQTFAAEPCNHEWSNWTVENEPNCGRTGSERRFCTKCFEVQYSDLPITGQHDWNDWHKIKSSTIKKAGLEERKCFKCGSTETKEIAKLKPFAKLSKKTVKLKTGQTYKLKLKYAKGDSVKRYKSSKKKVVTVSKKGKIKAKSKGTAKITVVMKSGKKATCTVKVKAKNTSSSNGNGNTGSGNENSGGTGTGAGSNGSGTNVEGTVYWTPNGEVYHSTNSCRTLSRSKTIYSGTLSECPKSRACKVCH